MHVLGRTKDRRQILAKGAIFICLGHDGTPRYLSVFLRSIICSVAVLAATNSEPYVTVSTVSCLFKNQSVGVVLTKCNTGVTDFPVAMSWSRLASRNVVVITHFPYGLGISFGISSLTFP